jgi:hypothetical protein
METARKQRSRADHVVEPSDCLTASAPALQAVASEAFASAGSCAQPADAWSNAVFMASRASFGILSHADSFSIAAL